MNFTGNLTGGAQQQRAGIDAMHTAINGIRPFQKFGEAGMQSVPAPEKASEAAEQETVRLAGELISRASQGSDVRFELVAAVRARIEAGTYRVSSAQVAERLLATMRQ